ncbi:hypothetical protein AMS68_000156 [Peltaster fructicola]|uniref:SigF-like NTF2-like domain-containing protein n=1 Tax=Peltaster fructicola TaxID=286661 RepID=A0A6H0XJ27_9PEZI|nr:hypothetical protein AMS68_000156 [Peltaster fructicola]
MEDPLQDISAIVHKLCQGSPNEQKEALETYFTEDAAFYHPFCRVDSFPGSRGRLLGIFRWYKILSPKIELDIQSVAYDEIKQILYVTIHQVFSIWALLGLHRSNVVLTTKLQLKKRKNKYYIQSQNDLYQTDQFMKFCTIPWGIGGLFVIIWQWFATLFCVVLARIFSFVTTSEQWYYDQGRQKLKDAQGKGVMQLADEARGTLLDHAEYAKQRLTAQVHNQWESNGTDKAQQYGKTQVTNSK